MSCKIFKKEEIKNTKELLDSFVIIDGMCVSLKELITSYQNSKLDSTKNKKDKVQWITAKGNHIPISEGETKKETLDKLKKYANKWAFYDNDVERGEKPKLVADG